MKTDTEDLFKWLETIPDTEDVLRELDSVDVPDVSADPEFQADLLLGGVTESILRAMEEEGVNRNQLAKLMGKSRQYVGKSLNENANFTLRRLAEFACALGRKVSIIFHRRDEVARVCRDESQWEILQSWHTSLAPQHVVSARFATKPQLPGGAASYCPVDLPAASTEETHHAEFQSAA